MQETSRYAVGIDIGTTTIRCVIGHLDGSTGTPTIVGVGSAPNSGMRKGTVAHLQGPAQAIDTALGEAERMSGYQVSGATVSINGSHLLSTKADGMIAVGAMDHEITHEDIMRIEEVATIGKVPANREILEVVPHRYRLDGQDNIKDPLGMTGTRLEINANVISALTPQLQNLHKSADMAKVAPHGTIPAVLASARAVLTEQQRENGVAVIDFGGATTSVAVFEEGDLQHIAVIPMGGINLTNDLAIGLKTDPEVAEKVKLAHAVAVARGSGESVDVLHDNETLTFQTQDIDEIIEARLEEIFEAVAKELKRAGRAGQLPNGIVLVGGSAQLKGITEFAKTSLGLAARVGKPTGFAGVADHIEEPQFACAIGLMLADAEGATQPMALPGHGFDSKKTLKSASSALNKFLDRFKA